MRVPGNDPSGSRTDPQAAADSARIAANAAGSQIDALRQQSDDFVAGSFEQGSQLGSVSAYLTADSPEQLLERQELLNDISGSQLNVLDPLTEMLAGLAVNEVIDGSGAPATVTVAVAITEPAELVAVNV